MKEDFMNIDSFEDFNRDEITSSEKLGNVLKNKRQLLSKDINSVATDLRVSKREIVALENGEELFNSNKSFARLLCRKYITYLEIEMTDDINSLVDLVYPTTIDPSMTQRIDTNITFNGQIKKDRKKAKVKRNIIYFIVLVVLISFAIISVKFLLLNLKDTTTEVTNETTLVENTTLEPNEIIEPEIIITDTVTFKDYDGETANYVLEDFETPGTYTLEIEATDADCYVDVTDASGKYIGDTGVISKGDKFTYDIKDQNEITINLGNTETAKIKVNDVEVDLSKVTTPGKNLIVFKDNNE